MTTLALIGGVLIVMVVIAAIAWVSNAVIALTPSDAVDIDPIFAELDFKLTQAMPTNHDVLQSPLLKEFRIGLNF